MNNFLKRELNNTKILFSEIPIYISIIFIVTVIAMNILSNMTLYQSDFLAIDGGFIVSWIVFLIMDLITIHFGSKAAIKLTIFAAILNLFAAFVFYLITLIPGCKDSPISGTWFILISSSIAFLVSGIINALFNELLGKLFAKKDKKKLEFAVRCFVSTILGQIIDNLIFSILTFMAFAPIFWNGFHWTFIQCLTCSILFAFIELAMEMLFSPIGYKISEKWTSKGIGEKFKSLDL